MSAMGPMNAMNRDTELLLLDVELQPTSKTSAFCSWPALLTGLFILLVFVKIQMERCMDCDHQAAPYRTSYGDAQSTTTRIVQGMLSQHTKPHTRW